MNYIYIYNCFYRHWFLVFSVVLVVQFIFLHRLIGNNVVLRWFVSYKLSLTCTNVRILKVTCVH